MHFHQLDVLVAPFRSGGTCRRRQPGLLLGVADGCGNDGRPLTTGRTGPRGCRKLCGTQSPGSAAPGACLPPSGPTSCCPVARGCRHMSPKALRSAPHSGSCAFRGAHSALDCSPPEHPRTAPMWCSARESLPAASSRTQASPGGQLGLHAIHGQCTEGHSATVTLGAQLGSEQDATRAVPRPQRGETLF